MKPSPLMAAALLLVAVAGCGARGGTEPRNVLVISIDTLRRDHLGCYGYSRPTSPAIDALASRGAVFDNALSTCSWTLPSHASLLTGRYPTFHGLQEDGTRLSTEIPTLAETFRDRGFHTMAVVSHIYVSSTFGLDRGFDVFDDSLIEGRRGNPIAGRVVDRFLVRLDEAPPGPFFGFVHFFDPHWDYEPPAPFDSRFTNPAYRGPMDGSYDAIVEFDYPNKPMPEPDRHQLIALYDGEIAYLDSQIARLLEELGRRGLLDRTVIALTADHGEEFKDHGGLGHGRTLFDELLRVPLIIAGDPAFAAGTRRQEVVSQVDLAPTLLALLDLDPLTDIQGVSIAGGGALAERTVFAESVQFGIEMRAARLGPFKLIKYLERYNCFDLGADPAETRPLLQDPTGGVLFQALQEYAANAESGWHLKFLATGAHSLRSRVRVDTDARLVEVRRIFSEIMSVPGADSSWTRFSGFEVAQDERSITFDLQIAGRRGEVAFRTEPPDAPVRFDIQVESEDRRAGVFLGRGEQVNAEAPFTLTRSDPRVQGLPGDYANAPSGCYVRAVIPPAETAPTPRLSAEERERLRALGYVDSRD